MEMLDSLSKEERDFIVEKYYIDYKNLSPVVRKMKQAFDQLEDYEVEEFLKCIDYKKPSEKMKESMCLQNTENKEIEVSIEKV